MNLKLTIFLLLSFSFLNAELLILHTSTNISPWKKSQNDADILVKIAKDNGIDVVMQGVPWKRSLLMVEKGIADGVINASYKKDRAKYAVYPMKNGEPDFSKRLNDGNTYYIYKNKNSTIKWDGKKFSNIDGPVGAKDAYAVIEDLKKYKNINIMIMGRQEHLISALIKGKISAYAASQQSLKMLFAQMPTLKDMIIKEPIPIRKKPYFVIFSKKVYEKKKDEIEKLWDGLKKYNEDNK